MTSREDRARALLEAAARDHDVDTAGLWSRLQPELTTIDRRPRSRPWVAVAAAAAVTLGVVGATVWASGWGDGTQPVPAVSSTGAVSPSPTPQTSTTVPPTSAPRTSTTSPTTTTAPPVAPALSTSSLLVAADFEAAGWVVDSVQANEGWGQSVISACQDIPGAGGPGRTVFRGDGFARVSGKQLATYQYAMDLGSQAEAAQLVDTIRAWTEGCAARTGDTVTSGRVRSVDLPGGQVGYWYTYTLVQSGGVQDDELVAVTRAGERLTVVVLHEYDGSTNIDRVDATELLTRALDRLG
jgi:hypothetical protein